MLPATLVTFATFLLKLGASPVYNMQPAFITANIGTTGRNIRNLPCISRKTNQSGVCMFAIDCLKANGTHLGTCIDRFYFGSCCHVPPLNDIIDNTIDTDIIPAREPPLRLSSTIKPITTTTKTDAPVARNTTTSTPSTTQSYKLTTFQSVDASTVRETTLKPKPSATPKPTKATHKPTKPVQIHTTHKPSTTTSTTTSTTLQPSTSSTPKISTTTTTTTKTTTTSTKKPVLNTRKPIETVTHKPNITSTSKPTIATSSTRKPSLSTTSTRKPSPSTTSTRKPSPSITSTRKPITTTSSITRKPSTTTSRTRKPSTTTTSSSSSSSSSSSRKPIATSTTKPSKPSTSSSTSSRKPIPTTTQRTTSTRKTTTKKPTTPVSTSTSTSTISTSSPSTLAQQNVTQALEQNEIDASSPTTSASIVTWTMASDRNASHPTTIGPPNSTSEAWVPMTTPDKWVPLPSVQPETSPSAPIATSTSTSTESASKPSITYIPLESTTLSASTQGVVTSAPVTSSTTPRPDDEVRPVNMSDFTDVCGRRMYPEGRIVGGEITTFGKWPWQISLRQWRTSTYLHKCGAALLNENWAITAAHCVDNVPPSDLLLRLGEHDLSTESEPYLHQERRVQIVASHPQFDPRTFEYDLALLRFYEPVTFQPNILPVCVPQSDENFVGRNAYVTGWGRLYEDGPLPSILQEVSVPVINNSVCESMYRTAGYIEHIPHIFICAGWRKGGFDSCEGDSGGPMVIQREDKRFLLAGVISWGIGCAEPNQPGVYTRISEFRDWINQILQF